MAQFDVYRNLNSATSKYIPYLLDIQNDLFSQLLTRVVVPLHLAEEFGQPAEILNPVFIVNKQKVVMVTPQLAGIAAQELAEPVTSLKNKRDTIIAALDFLFTGF
jgi:toxin CcdB